MLGVACFHIPLCGVKPDWGLGVVVTDRSVCWVLPASTFHCVEQTSAWGLVVVVTDRSVSWVLPASTFHCVEQTSAWGLGVVVADCSVCWVLPACSCCCLIPIMHQQIYTVHRCPKCNNELGRHYGNTVARGGARRRHAPARVEIRRQ